MKKKPQLQKLAYSAISSALMFATIQTPGSAAELAPLQQGISTVNITLTNNNGGQCQLDFSEAKAGPITFHIKNQSATALSEVELLSEDRILGEKENLAPGLPAVQFTLTLQSGDYQIYCPGAKQPRIQFTVTGEHKLNKNGSLNSLLADGSRGYQNYVANMAAEMRTAVNLLRNSIKKGDLTGSKLAYARARPLYEHIESDVEGFILPGFKVTDNAGNLDYLIDMRASNLDPAVGWHGFHAIEKDLFQAGVVNSHTQQLADELAKNVAHLATVAQGLTFKPEDLANGAASLLEEVQNSKISGEEEAYSHLDLVDFAANIEGAEQAFNFLKPGMQQINPELTALIALQFNKVKDLLQQYRNPSNLGGYEYYTPALKAKAGPILSRAVQALQEPLARIAAKVATAED